VSVTSFKNEFVELEEKTSQVKLSKEAGARIKKELKKLRLMAPMSAEPRVIRTTSTGSLALPWATRPKQAGRGEANAFSTRITSA